jgi:hypothetical protein
LLAILLGGASANGAPIADAGFFNGIPHTLITFETGAGGTPVIIGNGANLPMPANAYAAQGVVFSPAISWGNDGGAQTDAAQVIGGSPEILIPGPNDDDFTIVFSVPVMAFGFWVMDNTMVQKRPTFTALDASNQALDSTTFGPPFRDGNVGIVDYGFMGIVADRNIASVHITKDATSLDNFYFSPVPEPGALGMLGLISFVGNALARHRAARPPHP